MCSSPRSRTSDLTTISARILLLSAMSSRKFKMQMTASSGCHSCYGFLRMNKRGSALVVYVSRIVYWPSTGNWFLLECIGEICCDVGFLCSFFLVRTDLAVLCPQIFLCFGAVSYSRYLLSIVCARYISLFGFCIRPQSFSVEHFKFFLSSFAHVCVRHAGFRESDQSARQVAPSCLHSIDYTGVTKTHNKPRLIKAPD